MVLVRVSCEMPKMHRDQTMSGTSETVDCSAAGPSHVPRRERLPQSVGEWLPMDSTRLWEDCTQILVAVPVQNRLRSDPRKADGDWCYEFSVVVIKCDVDYFAVETHDGESWGWDLDSVDFYIQLSR